jgi:beta-glucosidase
MHMDLSALPKDFSWGAATSAYQIEGATQTDGRGLSIWDTFALQPGKTIRAESGAVACDHYNRYEQDLDMMKSMGLQAYRFSVAWPRVQPFGRGAVNEKGLGFYDKLVDGLLERGIDPHLTLYHWDLPQSLQDLGGWLNRDTAYAFADYAEIIARRLGDRVKTIATHNEPWCTAFLGFGNGKFAPGLADQALVPQVAHHLLLSHGLAMSRMRAVNSSAQLGIVLNQCSVYTSSDTPENRAEAALQWANFVQLYMHPLFKQAYPEVKGFVPPNNVQDGDLQIIGQKMDFLGVNYYTRIWCSKEGVPEPTPYGRTDMDWIICPEGLTKLLVDIHKEYPPLPPIYITENGVAYPDKVVGNDVPDPKRIEFMKLHIEAIAKAVAQQVDVRGFFYWSLMDNYEWDSGYDKRFGIVHVDYATQQRRLKDSAKWYRDFIAQQSAILSRSVTREETVTA